MVRRSLPRATLRRVGLQDRNPERTRRILRSKRLLRGQLTRRPPTQLQRLLGAMQATMPRTTTRVNPPEPLDPRRLTVVTTADQQYRILQDTLRELQRGPRGGGSPEAVGAYAANVAQLQRGIDDLAARNQVMATDLQRVFDARFGSLQHAVETSAAAAAEMRNQMAQLRAQIDRPQPARDEARAQEQEARALEQQFRRQELGMAALQQELGRVRDGVTNLLPTQRAQAEMLAAQQQAMNALHRDVRVGQQRMERATVMLGFNAAELAARSDRQARSVAERVHAVERRVLEQLREETTRLGNALASLARRGDASLRAMMETARQQTGELGTRIGQVEAQLGQGAGETMASNALLQGLRAEVQQIAQFVQAAQAAERAPAPAPVPGLGVPPAVDAAVQAVLGAAADAAVDADAAEGALLADAGAAAGDADDEADASTPATPPRGGGGPAAEPPRPPGRQMRPPVGAATDAAPGLGQPRRQGDASRVTVVPPAVARRAAERALGATLLGNVRTRSGRQVNRPIRWR